MRWTRAIRDEDGGGAAVEFALVGPMLVLLVLGIVVYGGWFWLAQGVQSLAAEGARAAIGGLDAAERSALAQGHVAAHAHALTGAPPRDMTVAVTSTGDALTVTVVYDASSHPLMSLSGLIPAPPARIERRGVVRTGNW